MRPAATARSRSFVPACASFLRSKRGGLLSFMIAAAFMLLITASAGMAQECAAQEWARLSASDPELGDNLGASVAISGDRVVVGAPNESEVDFYAGATYVFRYQPGSPGTWMEEAKLTASDGASQDGFGEAVAIDGDLIMVGAPGADGVGSNSGSAYVFGYNPVSQEWVESEELVPTDVAEEAYFGWSVAIEGDMAVVGAPGVDDARGAAYVFVFGIERAFEDAKLTGSDAGVNDGVGRSVSIDNGVIVAGATWGGADPRTIYLFEEPTGGWVDMTETARLMADDVGVYDTFGRSVCISGDVVIGGAPWDDTGGFRGSAFVFEKPAGGWADMTETAKLTASVPDSHDEFGRSVAVRGSYIVIGAPGAAGNPPSGGSAYVFKRGAGGWGEQAKLTGSDADLDAWFGGAVAMDGTRTVIGAEEQDVGTAGDAGSAFVFEGLDDCNENSVLDLCDIAEGTSPDDNGNGIPDECEGQQIPALSGGGDAMLAALMFAAAGFILRWRRSPRR
jgi:hypothetical protein